MVCPFWVGHRRSVVEAAEQRVLPEQTFEVARLRDVGPAEPAGPAAQVCGERAAVWAAVVVWPETALDTDMSGVESGLLIPVASSK